MKMGAGVAKKDVSPDAMLAVALQSLEDNKAEDIVKIDLQGKSAIADYMLIATGTSTRHVTTIADKMVEKLKRDAQIVPRLEGAQQADWVLIDASDVIIHVFRPEVREFYNLERMWTGQEAETPQLNG